MYIALRFGLTSTAISGDAKKRKKNTRNVFGSLFSKAIYRAVVNTVLRPSCRCFSPCVVVKTDVSRGRISSTPSPSPRGWNRKKNKSTPFVLVEEIVRASPRDLNNSTQQPLLCTAVFQQYPSGAGDSSAPLSHRHRNNLFSPGNLL